MIPAVAGSCQTYDNAKHYNLSSFIGFSQAPVVPPNYPKGQNFLFGEINNLEMGWLTGIRVFGGNAYLSNRGNRNQAGYDTEQTYIVKVRLNNADGLPAETLSIVNSITADSVVANGQVSVSAADPEGFANLRVGQEVSGEGINPNTFIQDKTDNNTIILNQPPNFPPDPPPPPVVSLTYKEIIDSCDGFDVDSTGVNWILTDFNSGGVRSMQLQNPFDLVAGESYSSSKKNETSGTRAVSWNDDGTKYYTGKEIDDNSSELREFDAITAWETNDGDTQVSNTTVNWSAIADITFNPDGTKMYLTQHLGAVYEYNLNPAWDSSTLVLSETWNLGGLSAPPYNYFINQSESPVRTSGTTPYWICGGCWNEDGTKFYVATLWGQIDENTTTNPLDLLPQQVQGNGGLRDNKFGFLEFSYK